MSLPPGLGGTSRASVSPLEVRLLRNGIAESRHRVHAVVCDGRGRVLMRAGDPQQLSFVRSALKPFQATVFVASGAADACGCGERGLAIACASHAGTAAHAREAFRLLWGAEIEPEQLQCPIPSGGSSCLEHNCSGKHAGFLTLTQHLQAGPEYVEVDHPIQRAIHAATEEVTEELSPGYGIDGCSAPNFATTLQGLARAMGRFAGASDSGDTRQRAMHRLTRAMAAYPDLVAGEGRACTELMRAMGGRVAIKTGAEAVFVAILPDQQRGIAVKIADGNSRASEAVIAALLVRMGALDADHPATRKRLNAVQTNWRGTETGILRLADGFL